MPDTDTDTDKDLKTSPAALETDTNFTEHLAAHISAMRHHLTGANEPPEPPYAPSSHHSTNQRATEPPPKRPCYSAR